MEHVERGQAGRLRGLLLAMPGIAFLSQCHFLALSPFLLAIAQETGTDLATSGRLMAAMSLASGIAAVVAGPASDRVGRKLVLVLGLALVSVSALGCALVADFGQMSALRFLGGLGSGTMMPSVYATAADRFPPRERGRALGWVMTGWSLAQLVGVPIVTFAASFGGWRGSVVGLALLTMPLIGVVGLLVPGRGRRSAASGPVPSSVALLRRPKVFFLMLSTFAERLAYSSVAIYLASYLIASYALAYDVLAVALMAIAAGAVLGTIGGGRVADRLPWKAEGLFLTGVLTTLCVPALMLIQPGVWISVAAGFTWAVTASVGKPIFFLMASQISREARGTVMSLHVTLANLAWIIAATAGGMLIGAGGFGVLGSIAAAASLLSAVAVVPIVMMERR
ncbi:MAG: MFS transporter [Chloroflexi bacterium]|nr:MFS transporter [Chloroflexota bacterium]